MNPRFRSPGDAPAATIQNRRTRAAGRILLIDDDPDIRQFCAEVLISSGYRVDTAADGRSGWNALDAVTDDSGSYRLLITDHNLPDLSGLQLIKKMRAARMALPVILISGELPADIDTAIDSETSIHEQDWNRSLQIAAALRKPFAIDDFLGTVRKVLSLDGNPGAQIDDLPSWRS